MMYSTNLAMVKPYQDFTTLLHDHCPQIEKRYLEGTNNESQVLISRSQSDLEKINIKESPYVVSKRINALQRLFTKNILRDWNDRAL